MALVIDRRRGNYERAKYLSPIRRTRDGGYNKECTLLWQLLTVWGGQRNDNF